MLEELFWVDRRDREKVWAVEPEELKEEWTGGIQLKRTAIASPCKIRIMGNP